jgi:Gpi18-like mannosyltransferase
MVIVSRKLLWMFASAVALRALLCLAVVSLTHHSVSEFAHLRDGDSYIDLADALRGNAFHLSSFDKRVFFGYQALIAGLSYSCISTTITALLLSWASSGIAAVLGAVFFRDNRIGWALVLLTPSYLMYSTLAMSESTLLALTLAGLCLLQRDRDIVGGIFLGFAGLVRPMACFAVLGYLVFFLARSHYRRTLVCAVSAAATVLIGYAAYHYCFGDALQGVRVYSAAGQVFGWPFESLLTTPASLWKKFYIWANVVITVGACFIKSSRLISVWLISNTLFVLCVDDTWGFHEFHRYIIPALPALFWVYRPYLPERTSAWAIVGLLSVVPAVFGLSHSA